MLLYYNLKSKDSDRMLQRTSHLYCREILLGYLRDFLLQRNIQCNFTLNCGHATRVATIPTDSEINNLQRTINRLYDINLSFYATFEAIDMRNGTKSTKKGIFFSYTAEDSEHYITGAQISSILFLVSKASIRRFLLSTDTDNMSVDEILLGMTSNYLARTLYGQFILTLLFIKFVEKTDKFNIFHSRYNNGCATYMRNVLSLNKIDASECREYLLDLFTKAGKQSLIHTVSTHGLRYL
jgi:hypothetical protein